MAQSGYVETVHELLVGTCKQTVPNHDPSTIWMEILATNAQLPAELPRAVSADLMLDALHKVDGCWFTLHCRGARRRTDRYRAFVCTWVQPVIVQKNTAGLEARQPLRCNESWRPSGILIVPLRYIHNLRLTVRTSGVLFTTIAPAYTFLYASYM